MSDSSENRPDCFGVLEIVFPKSTDGLRHSPPMCMACVFKTECLQTAMQQPAGVEVESEMVDRAYESRAISFIQRWSRRKSLHQKRKTKKTL
jgi:hypothetical protein